MPLVALVSVVVRTVNPYAASHFLFVFIGYLPARRRESNFVSSCVPAADWSAVSFRSCKQYGSEIGGGGCARELLLRASTHQ